LRKAEDTSTFRASSESICIIGISMDLAYIEIINTNKELRKELEDEITESKLKNKKLKSLYRELESCYKTLSHQDSTILAHEDEIESFKTEIKSLKQRLHKALQDLRHKGNASTAQDIHILRLEDKVDQLKKRIREITDKKLSQIKSLPMALPDILINIGTALDRIEGYINGDTTFDPRNTLNGIQISITTIREHNQRHAQENANLQGLLNASQGQINRIMNDMPNFRNDCLRSVQMMEQAWRNERQARQQRDDKINNLRDAVCENVYEKCWWRRRHTACAQQA
jgi:DNA repair exonuclease SbcCD ATPase subunit